MADTSVLNTLALTSGSPAVSGLGGEPNQSPSYILTFVHTFVLESTYSRESFNRPCNRSRAPSAFPVATGERHCCWRSFVPQILGQLRVYLCPSTVASIHQEATCRLML